MKKAMTLVCRALLCALLLCALPTAVSAATVTGECGAEGNNVTYVYDTDTKVLTLSGSGAVKDYVQSYPAANKSPFITNSTIKNNCTSIVIGDGITRIGNYTFNTLMKVTSITFPSTLESVGDYAFGSMNQMAAFPTGSSLVTIGTRAFASWTAATELTLPDTLETIGTGAFSSWKAASALTIPAGVRTIEDSAFSTWNKLETLVFEEGVQTIKANAFSNTKLTEANLPASLVSIDPTAFYSNSSLAAYKVAEGSASYCSVYGLLYSKDKTVLVRCPDAYQGEVTLDPACAAISDRAFFNCSGVTSVVLSDALASIGGDCFTGSGITSIVIPEGVTSIADGAFGGASYLTDVTVYSNTIVRNMFQNCSSLVNVTFGENVREIGESAFSGCSALTEITVPASVTSIGNQAFEYCSGLVRAEIEGASVELGQNIFMGCSLLKTVVLSEDLPGYGYGMFNACSSLTSVTIPNGLTEIPTYCFYKCSSLTSFDFPETVTSIGSNAFEECTGFTRFELPAGLLEINSGAFKSCSNLSEIELPEGLEVLGGSAFQVCTALTDIVIPENIVTIQGMLFAGCSSLKTVTVLGDLTQSPDQYCIWSAAFSNCYALEKVTFRCGAPSPNAVNSSAFNATPKNVEIHYPNLYPEWEERPFDVCTNGKGFVYVKDLVVPEVELIGAELRDRPANDGKKDLRFIGRMTPAVTDTAVIHRYADVTNTEIGRTVTMECPRDYAHNEDGTVLFTIVIAGIPQSKSNVEFEVKLRIEYEGEYEGEWASETLTESVNSVLQTD